MAERYILTVDELDEISGVDCPAQEGADVISIGKRAPLIDLKKGAKPMGRQAHQAMACADCGDDVDAGQEDCPTCGAFMPIHKADYDGEGGEEALAKRYFDTYERQHLARSGAAMPNGGFPIQSADDLHNAIQAFGRAKNKSAVAAHIKSRARALNLHSMLPKDGELAGLAKTFPPALPQENAMTPEDEKKLKDANDALAALTKSHQVLKSILNLPYTEQVYALRLPDTEQVLFLAKTAPERAEVSKPVYVAKDGTAFYRMDDDRFIKQAKRADEQDAKFAKMEEEEEVRKYEDAARTDLAHTKGTISLKAKLLRAITKFFTEEPERKEVIEMLKSNDEKLALAFKAYGFSGGFQEDPSGSDAPGSEFEVALQKFATDKKLTNMEEAEALFLDTPEGAAAYAALDAQRPTSPHNTH